MASRSIVGPHTRLKHIVSLAVDASGNLYVGAQGGGALFVFPPGANGDVAPMRIVDAGTNSDLVFGALAPQFDQIAIGPGNAQAFPSGPAAVTSMRSPASGQAVRQSNRMLDPRLARELRRMCALAAMPVPPPSRGWIANAPAVRSLCSSIKSGR